MGHLQGLQETHEAYVEHCDVVKQAKADMNLFAAPTSEGKKATKKGTEKTSEEASGKNCSEKKKDSQKTKEGAALSDAPAPDLCKEYKAIFKKDSAILCDSATKSNPATPSNSATFGNPSLLGNSDDVMLTSSSQCKDIIIIIVLRPLPIHLKVVSQQ
jgi:hypothetical protein